ncbi:pitrilysin family protein [Reyranella sp. CPCC 100927]|uniref:M16 family metallopeptidase n=1 Tax=Reyranella sp. CPCC 100927 TaxID=2599616 RepID=UPI0011B42D51|nr:pitrilysin family protein [Reyranella sp. CPCC 100927]TWT06054.1 insulinase family protein [Reyranella sp. CPCC 100927]
MTIRITTLDNGLRVVTDTMDHVETVALGMWVAAGARHEPAPRNGIAHLLEHMAFKGTKRRTARGIAEEIENVGGSLNAFTGRELTAYHAAVLKDDVALAVDLVADILLDSTFVEEELQRERGVVLQEIGQANDTPDDVIFDNFQAVAFPEQALGRPVLGTEATVNAIARDDLFDWLRNRYVAERMVLSAGGAIEHDRFVDLANKAFGRLPRATGDVAVTAPVFAGGDRRDSDDLEQAHLVIGGEAFSYLDPDHHALAVFSTLFGGGMSSRLFQRIREDRGLVYSIYSFNAAYRDGGLFGIYAGTAGDSLPELVPIVCEEFRKVADDVDDAEVARARAQLKAGTLMALESSHSRCEQAARQLLIYGRPIPYTETVDRIEAVDTDAVRRVARRLLASPPAVCALGPIDKLESYDAIARRLKA